MKDLWEYVNRYTYLPRVQNRTVLVKAVQAAVSGMIPGPFAYAERWDEANDDYIGLAISGASSTQVVIDGEAVIVDPAVAEVQRQKYVAAIPAGGSADPVVNGPTYTPATTPTSTAGSGFSDGPQVSADPRTFHGTVMISPDRPARDIHQIVEAIIEQLTTIAGADVAIKLEIDANVPAGLDRAKVRTLMENAATLGFIDKVVK